MTKKTLIIKALGLSTALLFFGACKQEEEQQAPSGQKPETSDEVTSIDASNPKEVAKAFITAIARKDYENAVKYVAPKQREEFAKALEEGMPPLPANPDIQVLVKEDGAQADVAVVNADAPASGPPFGLDLKLIDGKWWVVK